MLLRVPLPVVLLLLLLYCQVSDSLLGLLLADKDEKLKITSTGLKIFERHELRGKESGKCQYRIAQVGRPYQKAAAAPDCATQLA